MFKYFCVEKNFLSQLILIAWLIVCELLLSNNRFTFTFYGFSLKVKADVRLTKKIGDLLRSFDSSCNFNVLKKMADWTRLILLTLKKQFFLNQLLLLFTICEKSLIKTSNKMRKKILLALTKSLKNLCY